MNSKEIETCLSSVVESIPDPRVGLPEEVLRFLYSVTPMINVDLLVQHEERGTLFSWRDDVYGKGWHIPGGIIRFRETIEKRICEVARIELGATVNPDEYPCDIAQFFDGCRGHFISLLYPCRLTSSVAEELLSNGKPERDKLKWIQGVPDQLLSVHRRYETWFRKSTDSYKK